MTLREYRGYFYSVLSVVLMALAGPLQKIAMKEITPLHVLFFSNFSAFLVAALTIMKTQGRIEVKLKMKVLIISILYLVAQLSFSFAIKAENPVIVNSVSRLYLVFNFLISFFIFKESFSLRQAGAILLILAGTVGLSLYPSEGINWSFAASLTVFYAFLFSVHNSLLKSNPDQNVKQLILFQNGLSSLVFSLTLVHQPFNLLENKLAISCACLAGTLSSFFGFMLYKKGLDHLSFSDASSVRSLSPILGIVVVYPFYPVQLTGVQKLALISVLLGCLIFNFKRKLDEPA